jgi:hypothetical protein
MTPSEIRIEQCEAARELESEFGTQRALSYLIGEKFLNFLEAAEDDAEFRAEIPAFVAKIKTIFKQWQLAEFLETARPDRAIRSQHLRRRRPRNDRDGAEIGASPKCC